MSSMIIPPGGFLATSMLPAAARQALSGRSGATRSPSTKRRKTKRKSKRASSKRTSRSSKRTGGKKIKFGSPAWRKKYKLGKKKR